MKSVLKSIFITSLLVFFQHIVFAQDADKNVAITVSGSGKSKEAAIQAALRSAIEQAFGAFISTKTEILNDSLVSDQIVSVSNGNIQKYEITSEIQLPNGDYSVSLHALVSIFKLSSFCESKGIKIEVQGGMFSANIKQQTLNEESEIKAVINVVKSLTEIAFKCFDYSVNNVENPTSKLGDNKTWILRTTTNVNPNNNLDLFVKYLYESMSSISMTESEKDNYLSLNKYVYTVDFREYDNLKKRTFYFRRSRSVDLIKILTHQLIASSLSYRINYEGLNRHFDGFWYYHNITSILNSSKSKIMGFENVKGGLLPFITFVKDYNGSREIKVDLINLSMGYRLPAIFKINTIQEKNWELSFSNYKSISPYLSVTNNIELTSSELEKIKSIEVLPVDFTKTDYVVFIERKEGGYFPKAVFIVGPKRDRENLILSLYNDASVNILKVNELPNNPKHQNKFSISNIDNIYDGQLALYYRFFSEGNLKIIDCKVYQNSQNNNQGYYFNIDVSFETPQLWNYTFSEILK